MTTKPSNLRLDEILLEDGLVTEDQITEALAHQRENGGKIGSHLLQSGAITEADLVKALTRQFKCEGVVLSDISISTDVLRMIPAEIALARRVVPFDFDVDKKILCVACEDPDDKDLLKELSYVVTNITVRLYLAVEHSLKQAIARLYVAHDDGSAAINQLTDTGSLPIADSILSNPQAQQTPERRPARGEVLLVTDDIAEGNRMRSLLEQQAFRVTTLDSADDAIELIGAHQFGTVFIKDTVPGDYLDLIDRLRKISPKTNVRYFESAARLLIDRESATTEADLLVRNLDLFTSLLASREDSSNNSGHTVGQYVDRLCKEMGLPSKERLLITAAGYLHDLSKFYYGPAKVPSDPRGQIDLTVKLLDSLSFSPVIIEILRSTYINLRSRYTKRLPIEVLGGNIVTVVDIFCDNVSINEKLSIDRFEAIRRKFDELTGKLFLEEVVSAFVTMIQRDVLKKNREVRFGQVLTFGQDKKEVDRVCRLLQVEGFQAVPHQKIKGFVDMFARSRPNMALLLVSKSPSELLGLMEELDRKDLEIKEVPTFILAEAQVATAITHMFERGIEDIIVSDDALDLLVAKMRKVRDRLEDADRRIKENGSASRGTLEAMNLIDLLQALGPSRKTARLQISSEEQELTIYLREGNIVYAECGEKAGEEAVWSGIGWTEGNWFIEPVKAVDLPEPNNDMSNESILMEGVRLLDESRRTDQPSVPNP